MQHFRNSNTNPRTSDIVVEHPIGTPPPPLRNKHPLVILRSLPLQLLYNLIVQFIRVRFWVWCGLYGGETATVGGRDDALHPVHRVPVQCRQLATEDRMVWGQPSRFSHVQCLSCFFSSTFRVWRHILLKNHYYGVCSHAHWLVILRYSGLLRSYPFIYTEMSEFLANIQAVLCWASNHCGIYLVEFSFFWSSSNCRLLKSKF